MINLMKRKKITAATGALLAFMIMWAHAAPSQFRTCGWVESVRDDGIITVLLEKRPEKGMVCFLVRDEKEIGTVRVLSTVFIRTGRYPWRVIASFSLNRGEDVREMTAGREIMLKTGKAVVKDYSEPFYQEKILYKKTIRTHTDKRDMVLVGAGKFMFGSESGEKDESPALETFLEDFYIDKYEVSNSDYHSYIKATRADAPLSWGKGAPEPGTEELPVLVTFFEAQRYAEWAGKRLPTEAEWEKAARGIEYEKGKEARAYPWGDKFIPGRVNSLELWSDRNKSAVFIRKYSITERGLLPVVSLEKESASPYGAVNMSGNASEWTSSWYMPYQGKGTGNSGYGRQYKVIRGGAWYHDRYQVRVTRRLRGGIPSLYMDNTAGFRCVKDPADSDIIR